VGALELGELDSVLQQTQRAVGKVKLSGFSSPHITGLGQCSKSTKSVGEAHRIIGGAVNQLKKLNGEFNVSKTTRA
jgi:hypothetical protein